MMTQSFKIIYKRQVSFFNGKANMDNAIDLDLYFYHTAVSVFSFYVIKTAAQYQSSDNGKTEN